MNHHAFWNRKHAIDFMMFSTSHWVAVSLVACFCMLLFGLRQTIRSNPGLRAFTRLLLVTVLLFSEGSLQLWYITQEIWEKDSSLPLELCGITLLLSIIMLLTRSRLLYSFLYFAGTGGAFIALLTPNLVYPFPHFRFLLFFVAHGGIVLASLYMTWIEGYKPTWKSLFFTMLCLNLVAVLVYSTDRALGANYMFLVHKPGTFSVLDYFGSYPYYLLVEEAFAFVVFLLMYLIFFRLPQRFNSRHNA